MDSALDVLHVSLWANSAKSYEHNYGCKPELYDQVLDNLRNFNMLRMKSAGKAPYLVLHMPLNRSNYTEILRRVELCAELGCDKVSFTPFVAWSPELKHLDLTSDQVAEVVELLEKHRGVINRLGLDHNLDDLFMRYRLGRDAWKNTPCYIGWYHLRIKTNGEVWPCSSCPQSLGNLNDNTLAEMWNGQAMQTFRSNAISKIKPHPDCLCDYCCDLGLNLKIDHAAGWLPKLQNIWRHKNRREQKAGNLNMSGRISRSDWLMGVHLLNRLPKYVRRPHRLQESREELAARLENREANFLAVLKRAVFNNPASPYLELFKLAGCDFGDAEKLVNEYGLEAALHELFKAGIYLTVDSFKGRCLAELNGKKVTVNPDLLRNPLVRSHLELKSGGSRSAGTGVVFDLNFINHCALDTALVMHCRGGNAWLKANWEVPGGGALFSLLELCKCGSTPLRWFSQIAPQSRSLHARYRYSHWLLFWGGLLGGRSMPRPKHVSLEDARPIASWMAQVLAGGQTPYLLTYPSNALRVCRSAVEHGFDISGAQFTIAGEPCTATRMKSLRSCGVSVQPKYGIMETGPVGYGCEYPDAPDDVHLLSDLHALIQPGKDHATGNLPPRALLFTSLSLTAPIVLINVSMGDQAIMEKRDCGCKLQDLGWRTHLKNITSFEKLTLGGMNFSDHDVVRVLEEDLPNRFGGGLTDYQIVEKEGHDGEPILRLVASPDLGEIDHEELIRVFYHGLGKGSQANSIMAQAWREGGIMSVERCVPYATRSGKILHLHQETKE